ncbi:ATP-binding protein [Pontiella sulfatireligans]|uniref:AAA+ ATPase domain-containing protein n=1 Tax=Pontiella sulfatireligans TaxID=2750658 RepID=A0A6C2UNV5_9BACT|nr:ATP-binding protein [Pontiella sulfatireligans]VGO21868.1 hypothetical protein SCARR_03948 [Pontiella sulfatireligans]
MLNRHILSTLNEWKKSPLKKPLVLRGARQVGKTVAVRMFANSYSHFTELNMELPENIEFFKRKLTPEEIIQAIKLRHGIPTDADSWLLFLDEIQSCPEAVAMLRYFHEKLPALHVVAAGSLLEIALQREHISFPVGRVEFRYMYPMNFEEFIGATSSPEMQETFRQVPSPAFATEELFALYHRYALVGGMPEAVAGYAVTRDIVAVNRIYENLFTAYVDDIPKYAKNQTMTRILRHCLQTAPFQAGKRIRFTGFGESGYGSRETGEALRTLEQVMLISLLYPTTAFQLPFIPDLKKSPRLQWIDTGLLHYITGIQQNLIGIDDLSNDFRGGLLEQLTGQELLAAHNDKRNPPQFWVRQKTQSQAEIDFMLSLNGVPLPVEVKSGATGKLRSLHLYMENCPDAHLAIRLYRGPHLIQEAGINSKYQLANIPYYHASKIPEYAQHLNVPQARNAE